jgi:hypothetical protein
MGGLIAKPRWQFAICLVVALAFRAPSFGDPYIHVDEAFYFLVGREMHAGALPYVDIWDRKPPGLFLLYYLFSTVPSVWFYQIAACLSASTTAFLVCRMTSLWDRSRSGLLGAVGYLAAADLMDGIGGQAPVFYNLPMAAAALAILSSLPSLREGQIPRRVYGAMAACGMAITIKQTALFESLFFGCACVFIVWRARVDRGRLLRFASLAALIGAAPTLAWAAFYFLAGHWTAFWQAMVISNLVKPHPVPEEMYIRMLALLVLLAPLWLAAYIGMYLLERCRAFDPFRWFMIGWILTAIVGVSSVPNFYHHYTLPLILPLSVVAGQFYSRPIVGSATLAGLTILAARHVHLYDFSRWADTRTRMGALAHLIRSHDQRRGLLVFDGPPSLYFLSGHHPLSPLAFPQHLHHAIERNVSQFNTAAEIRRIIAKRPGAVVIAARIINVPTNLDSRMAVMDYVTARCRFVGGEIVPTPASRTAIVVYGDCR